MTDTNACSQRQYRFFVDQPLTVGDTIICNDTLAHHSMAVLRHRSGDHCILCNDDGFDYHGIFSVHNSNTTITIIAQQHNHANYPGTLHLLFSLLKNDLITWVIQKATELGVTDITPFISARSVAENKNILHKQQRWHSIATHAAAQCGRSIRPRLHTTIPFTDAVSTLPDTQRRYIASTGGADGPNTLRQTVNGDIAVLIGPEGGFTIDEERLAIDHGCLPLSLGKRILRAETAAIAAIAILTVDTTIAERKNG